MDKVPPQAAFFDLSDYARPAARWLVRVLPPFVTPVHLTLAFTGVGAAAALLFALDRWLPAAGLLLLVKSGLDAADGSLARARRQPSRIGRFLDSICDFLVTALVFVGIALGAERRLGEAPWLLAMLALVSAMLQCSAFSYYYVRYRAQTGGDPTSRVQESAEGYAGDNPTVLAVLYFFYRLIYGWQDALMDALDRRLAPRAAGAGLATSPKGERSRRVPPAFLTATTVLGLGMQLLVIAVCAAFGEPVIALWLFVTVFNIYWFILLIVRAYAPFTQTT